MTAIATYCSVLYLLILPCMAITACREDQKPLLSNTTTIESSSSIAQAQGQSPVQGFSTLSAAALSPTEQKVSYDPSYFSITYPGGDVPADRGVCTDVVIRAYRLIGRDLQVLVHEDMKMHFQEYPQLWGLSRTDKNIDHRRVPNLMTFLERQGGSISISNKGSDYLPGDVVAWRLAGGLTHIGIVVPGNEQEHPYIVHNIGAGQVRQDFLFSAEIIGHYRWL